MIKSNDFSFLVPQQCNCSGTWSSATAAEHGKPFHLNAFLAKYRNQEDVKNRKNQINMRKILVTNFSIVFLGFSVFAISSCDSTTSDGVKRETPQKRANNEINAEETRNYVHAFNAKTQVHNYSRNFDFDGDIDSDSMYFVGTGGAHLYYYLKIRLSSTKKTYEFHDIQIDDPTVYDVSYLKKTNFLSPNPPACVVDYYGDLAQTHFGGNLSEHALFFRLEKYVYSKSWLSKGINSDYILLYFDQGEWTIKNFH